MTSSTYIPSTDKERDEMNKANGVKKFDELLSDNPKNLIFLKIRLKCNL